MDKSGIYCIKNIKNGKKYIGQSSNLGKRKKTHFTKLRGNRHASSHLQSAFNKYGENNFVFQVLLFCKIKELTKWEQHFIDSYDKNKLYNVRLKCVDSNLGMRHSEETKKKLSKIVSGRKHSEETKKKMSLVQSSRTDWKCGKDHPMYGTTRSKKQKEAISKRMSGKNHPMYGKHHTEESKQRTSTSLMGHSVSKETREKMSKAKRGKKPFNFNKKRKGASSKYLGVSFDKSKNKWSSHLTRKGKRIYIGNFKLEVEAAKAYDNYVVEHNLTDRKLNFV